MLTDSKTSELALHNCKSDERISCSCAFFASAHLEQLRRTLQNIQNYNIWIQQIEFFFLVRLGNSLGINADTASTERSHHDDGYGTESGSNQKVNTVSKKFYNNKIEKFKIFGL